MDPVVLVARDLLHLQTGLDDPDVHQGLDLEPGAVERDPVQAVPPEGVVAVAEVGVAGAELGVHDRAEYGVAELADRCHVVRAAAVGEPRPLGEVGARDQGRHIADDLLAVGRAVRVDHHDDVARARGEAADQGVTLALAALFHDLDAGPQLPCDADRAVGRVPVHEDDFMDPVGQCLEHVRQILRLVHRGDHHAHRRRDREIRGDRPEPAFEYSFVQVVTGERHT